MLNPESRKERYVEIQKGVDSLKGCFNGWLKFSYVISAPLHLNGFLEFFGAEGVSCANKLTVTCDLIFHLAFWVVPLIMEIWSAYLQPGTVILREVQAASLYALITAIVGLLIAQVFAMIEGGQDAGRLYPSTKALITGGAYASIAFSSIYVVLATLSNWPEYTASDDDHNNELAQLRKQTLWVIVLKFFAVQTAQANASFWGCARPSVPKM